MTIDISTYVGKSDEFAICFYIFVYKTAMQLEVLNAIIYSRNCFTFVL